MTEKLKSVLPTLSFTPEAAHQPVKLPKLKKVGEKEKPLKLPKLKKISKKEELPKLKLPKLKKINV